MGVLNTTAAAIWKLFQPRAEQSFELQEPSDGPHHSTRIIYVPRTEAGVRISEDTALTYGAVYACTRIIAETVASLSWHVFRERANGGKDRVPGRVQTVLRDLANPETSAFAFREQMIASALLWGNGFAEIERDGAGRVVNLWQLAPDRVQPDRTASGRLVYVIDNRLQPDTILEADEVMHLHGLGFDGITGYSIVRLAARSIGIGIAGDKFGGAFYGNGTALSGVLQTDVTLTDPQRENLRQSWKEMYQGPDKAFSPAVLEAGLKWQSLGMPMTDAQFLENRKFQVTDIARWFRVPPHKLADLERATFSNIEQQSIEFVQDTIMPWAIRLEQEANRKLFGQNREGFFTKLNLNSLLRGDAESRFKAYAIGRQWGWLSANAILELEDMNPIGPQGDVYLAPVNMVNAKQFTDGERKAADAAEPAITVTEGEDGTQASLPAMAVLRTAHRDLITDAFVRVAKRESKWAANARQVKDAQGAARSRAVMTFLASEGHQQYAREAVLLPTLAFARVIFGAQLSDATVRRLHDTVELMLGERLMEAQARLVAGDADDLADEARGQAEQLLERIIALRLSVAVPQAAA
jgi:HK97 family phage portal protein